MIFVKILLLFPIAGIAYEFIKLCAYKMKNPFFFSLIWPGLMLQKLTTREPDDEQLEVALASLRQVLHLEKEKKAKEDKDVLEVASLSEVALVEANAVEFQEH